MAIMLRAFISYKPFKLFFTIASFFLVFGFALLGFLGLHYLETGAFSPHIWAGFVGGTFSFFGFTTLITGLVGDMLVRIRLNQEEILYQLKRSRLEENSSLVNEKILADLTENST